MINRLLLCALGLVGCVQSASLGTDLYGERQIVADIPATVHEQLDLLFVVDDSSGMASRQLQLVDDFSYMLERLRFGYGLPDLHVGVVSTDLGVGEFQADVPGCSSTGMGGRLGPKLCAQVDGSYLAQERDADGELLTNFAGELTDAFACSALLGERGCDYEQPLEAMRIALDGSHPESLGFRRDGAVLGVFVLTDEDDCSAGTASLFDPTNDDFMGHNPEFRCFEGGVACDGDDVFVPGRRYGCRARAGSGYVNDVRDYVGFLQALVEPGDAVVTVLAGDPSLVEVLADSDGTGPTLAPACGDGEGSALPSVRLHGFADGFADRGGLIPLCTSDAPPVPGVARPPLSSLEDSMRRIRAAMGTACLAGPVSDVDRSEPGRQIDCEVRVVPEAGEPFALSECDSRHSPESSSAFPCWLITSGGGEHCGDFQTQLQVSFYDRQRVGPIGLPGRHVQVECLVDLPVP